MLPLLPVQPVGPWGKGRPFSFKIKPSAMLGCCPVGELPVVDLGGLLITPTPTRGSGITSQPVLVEPRAGEESPKGGCKLF